MTARRAWQRPALRVDERFERHRSVGWLELFFDLVFVVVIARLAHHLTEHPSPGAAGSFVLLFLAVFWVWNAFTYYTERFESDGLETRLATFMAILPVAGLALFADDGLGGHYPGFASAYLLARAVNIGQWVRAAVHVPRFRPVMWRFLAGFGIAVALVAAGAAVAPAARVTLFAAAVAVEIATPLSTVTHQSALPRLSTSKFPERFGLLTMIVLGESMTGVVVGLSDLADRNALSVGTLAEGIAGIAIGFAFWWLYYDLVGRRHPRPAFGVALSWVYLHAAAMIGITAAGAGIAVVLLGPDGPLGDRRLLVVAGVVVGLLALAALQPTLARAPDEPTRPVLAPGLTATGGVVLGVVGGLDLDWTAAGLLTTLVLGLSVPVVCTTWVWFTSPITDEPRSEPPAGPDTARAAGRPATGASDPGPAAEHTKLQ